MTDTEEKRFNLNNVHASNGWDRYDTGTGERRIRLPRLRGGFWSVVLCLLAAYGTFHLLLDAHFFLRLWVPRWH